MDGTLYIAIYGALLATLMAIRDAWRARRKIEVKLTPSLGGEFGEKKWNLVVRILNVSEQPINISGILFQVRDRKYGVSDYIAHFFKYGVITRNSCWITIIPDASVSTAGPVTISPHDSHSILIPNAYISGLIRERGTKVIRAVVQDKLARNTYSCGFELAKN